MCRNPSAANRSRLRSFSIAHTPVLSGMPPRAEITQGIRQVSEVLIQVLSMLLHCSLQIMENPTAIDAEGDMPVNELQTMLIELQSQLQSQRAMLEDVLEQLPNQRGASSPARAGTMRNPPSPSQAPGLQAQSETSETAWELKSKPSRHPFRQ